MLLSVPDGPQSQRLGQMSSVRDDSPLHSDFEFLQQRGSRLGFLQREEPLGTMGPSCGLKSAAELLVPRTGEVVQSWEGPLVHRPEPYQGSTHWEYLSA